MRHYKNDGKILSKSLYDPKKSLHSGDIRLKGLGGIFLLVLILSIFFASEVGNRPFADPDEGRYVEIPREMVVTGDFITPRLNGLKYFEKPPLFYWMQAGIIKILGINETSMRLWPIIFAVLGCLGVFLIGSKRRSSSVGLLSAAVLATNILYYAASRLITPDLMLSVIMSGTLWCFFDAFAAGNQKKSTITAMYVFAAFACLAKGLIGIVLPGLTALLWIIFTGSRSKIKEMLHIPGILIFLILVIPWHAAVSLRNEDFLHFYFVVEHFLRYTTEMHHRYQPPWFFIAVLAGGLLPWTGFFLAALKDSFKKASAGDSESIFLLCWIFGILGFFSLSGSKLIPYIFPILPPIALITGILLAKPSHRDFEIGVFLNILLWIAALIACHIAKSQISDVFKNPEALFLQNLFFALGAVAVFLLISLIFLKKIRGAIIIVYIFIGADIMWVINKAAVFYQETKKPGTKRFASVINMNKKEDDLIYCYKRYYQDFPVYLNSTVGVVDFIGELEFGSRAEPENGKLIAEKQFRNLWITSPKRIFLLLSRKHYKDFFADGKLPHRILDFDEHFSVLINK
ncbi:MAG: glycosyltransferase family 39 protein [Holosporaceae bacterium]|jgi:4-amino-4-deoxy-L-arabinose transferase-like glycosyltransferase|nr:glycosyltransferase family 39 protein [Holosporaceae bacterium]